MKSRLTFAGVLTAVTLGLFATGCTGQTSSISSEVSSQETPSNAGTPVNRLSESADASATEDAVIPIAGKMNSTEAGGLEGSQIPSAPEVVPPNVGLIGVPQEPSSEEPSESSFGTSDEPATALQPIDPQNDTSVTHYPQLVPATNIVATVTPTQTDSQGTLVPMTQLSATRETIPSEPAQPHTSQLSASAERQEKPSVDLQRIHGLCGLPGLPDCP